MYLCLVIILGSSRGSYDCVDFSNICGCTWCGRKLCWSICMKWEVTKYCMESGMKYLSLTVSVVWDYCMYVFSCDCTMYHMFSTCCRKVLYIKIDDSISTYNFMIYGCEHHVHYVCPYCTVIYFFEQGLSGLIISDRWYVANTCQLGSDTMIMPGQVYV